MTVTVWGVATKVDETAAHYNRLGYLTGAHAYKRLALELPDDGVAIDADHDHQERGRLVYGELGGDGALRAVAVIDGDELTRAEEPIYFSAELELRGDVDKRFAIAREAALVGLSVTLSPASLGAVPVRMRAGDIRSSIDRYSQWPSGWELSDPLLASALDHLQQGGRLGIEHRSATAIVDLGRRPSLEPAGLRPAGRIEYRSAKTRDVSYADRVIELVAVPYGVEATVEHRGRMIRESFANTAFAHIDKQDNRDRIKVNLDHDFKRPVGRVVGLEPFRRDGLGAELKISKTRAGDETLALAEDRVLDASIGFAIPPGGERWEGSNRRRVVAAYLDHIALVSAPAYATANVLAVRGANPHG